MPEEVRRRYLIATGVTTGLFKTTNRLTESVGRIADIFQHKLGYDRITTLDLNPAKDEMRRGLRSFAKQCHHTDLLVLYHTGHADMVAGKHRLWMGDTSDPVTDTLVTSELAELMLADTEVSNLLIILDTCFAGQGGTELLITSLNSVADFSGKTLLAINGAHPREQVQAGDFARLFERSIDHPSTAGYEPRYLSLPVIVSHINKDPERKKWQTVSYSTVLGTDDVPFLLNPRYDIVLHGLDLATQLQIEQDEQRREDLEKFFNPRARGVDVPQETGWNFLGRYAALRDLSVWLSNREDRRTFIVTGDPGSGKSAVIGRLVILSDREWGRTVPRQNIPADTIPPTDSIDVAIHARNRTSEEVLQALCSAAHITGETPTEFLHARAGKPMLAAIDAIDEAVDPDRLVTAILNPLIEAGPQFGFRLLLGTRLYLLDRLSEKANRIDLDDQHYTDPKSLRAYAERRLRAVADSPYATADAELVKAVANAVAVAAGRSFLVARITSRTLAAMGYLANPADPLWRDSLPGTAAQAMQQDLDSRLRDDADRAVDLLRPLAFAGGNGLPWEDLWAPLASLLADKDYRDEDLIWLRRNAGSYVVEALEAGRSVYRLYHAALADYLRHDVDDKQIQCKFVSYLLSHVSRTESGEFAWFEAHPYILSHLATHAAAADQLTELIFDPCYLACATAPGLLAALPTAQSPEARQVAVAYERAVHRLRQNNLPDKLSYLELAARGARAVSLAERIKNYPLLRKWSVGWTQWPPDYPHRVLDGHRGPVYEVVGVNTGDYTHQAASVGDDGTLRLWDLVAAEPINMHKVTDAALVAVDVIDLPGPIQVAVVLSADGVLRSYDLATMSRLLNISVHNSLRGLLHPAQLTRMEMRCLQLPDGRWAAVTGGPGMLTALWDIQTGASIVRLPAGIEVAHLRLKNLSSGVTYIISKDAALGAEQVFDLGTGRRVFKERNTFSLDDNGMPSTSPAKHAQLKPDFPFAVDLNGRVIILSPLRDFEHSHEKVVLTGHGADVTDADVVEVPGKPTTIVSSSADGTVRLWDIASDSMTRSSGMQDNLFTNLVSVSTQPESLLGMALAAKPDENVAVLDLTTGEPIARLKCSSGSILAVTCGWIPEVGHAAITFEADGTARVWRLPSGDEVTAFGTYFGAIRTLNNRLPVQAAYVPLPGRPLAVTCGYRDKVIVWDLVDKRIHNVLGKHAGWTSALDCVTAHDGTFVAATGGHDNRINIWNVLRGHRIAHLRIVSRTTFLRRRDAGYATAVSIIMTQQHRLVVLVLCEDGKLRVFQKRRRRPGFQRTELDGTVRQAWP